MGVTIGAEFKYMESDYEAARQLRAKEMADHNSKLKGQSFKLFNHPQTLFDKNPYRQVCLRVCCCVNSELITNFLDYINIGCCCCCLGQITSS